MSQPGDLPADARLDRDRLWTIGQVAAYLQVPVGTIYQWRHRGLGPVGLRVGRHVRFRSRDVEAWLERSAAPQGSPPLRRAGRGR